MLNIRMEPRGGAKITFIRMKHVGYVDFKKEKSVKSKEQHLSRKKQIKRRPYSTEVITGLKVSATH